MASRCSRAVSWKTPGDPPPAQRSVSRAARTTTPTLDGQRRETDLATGATTLAETFADHSGWVANGSVNASQKIWSDLLRVRASAYTGFRVPTLNELYRPFRVGNDITEANASLRPERLYGGESGLEFRPAKPWLLLRRRLLQRGPPRRR